MKKEIREAFEKIEKAISEAITTEDRETLFSYYERSQELVKKIEE